MWLLSAGKEPEQNVVIWDVETGAALTSGTTSQPVIDLAWCTHTPLPAFVTLSKVLSHSVIKPLLRCAEHLPQELHSGLLWGNYLQTNPMAHSSVCRASHTLAHPSDLKLDKGCRALLFLSGLTAVSCVGLRPGDPSL